MRLVFLFVLGIYSSCIWAQLNTSTFGDAFDQGGNCFVVTPDALNQSGGVWFNNPIDFADDFEISYQSNFGLKDANGADGMAMVFKRNSNVEIGGLGGGLGYAGISPSFVVEFDTWQNVDNDDPTWDHIAITRNGIADHNNTFTTIAGPIEASAATLNIEDGQDHDIKIEWVAATQTFSVYFDCILRLSIVLDIKGTIFSGDDTVFFGFVGSTGGFSNLHQVCFNDVTFVDNLTLQDETICIGESVMLDATVPSGVGYSWTPQTGVSDPTIPNPILTPNTTTTYTVMIENLCGDTRPEEVTITVDPVIVTSTFNQVSPICNGDILSPLPTISNEGIEGTWSPDLDNTVTTEYTFTPNPRQCGTTQTMTIAVFDNPMPLLEEDYFLCFDTSGNPVLAPTIDTGLSTPVYNFTWFLEGVPITGETGGSIIPQMSGSYEVLVENAITLCTAMVSTTVRPLSQPEFETVLRSGIFSENPTIEVVPTTEGTFEYRIDNGPWQETPIFTNIPKGEHIIAIRDTRGCIENTRTVFVIGYPKFFTPDGDGINETWNIDAPPSASSFLASAELLIYNRYGKLLKQLDPSRDGWTGLFNGQPLPSDDYWFVINYTEPSSNERKRFTAHFTLKR